MNNLRLWEFVPCEYKCGDHVITVSTSENYSYAQAIEGIETRVLIGTEKVSSSITWDMVAAVKDYKEAKSYVDFIMQLKFEDLPLHINSENKVIRELCKLRLGE